MTDTSERKSSGIKRRIDDVNDIEEQSKQAKSARKHSEIEVVGNKFLKHHKTNPKFPFCNANVDTMTFAQATAQRNIIAQYIIALLARADAATDKKCKLQEYKMKEATVEMKQGIEKWREKNFKMAKWCNYLAVKLANLGLATCKRIQKLLEASLDYQAETGEGVVKVADP